MSNYEYTDASGDKMAINTYGPKGNIAVELTGRDSGVIVYIDNADAPTVAAEILKAAGQDSVIMPKSALPAYEVHDDDYLRFTAPDGYKSIIGLDWTPERLRHLALARLAAAEYIENRKQREADEAKKLQKRREELLKEFNFGANWDHASEFTQAAIDRIIDLEDGQDSGYKTRSVD